jgi:hypothetical protein
LVRVHVAHTRCCGGAQESQMAKANSVAVFKNVDSSEKLTIVASHGKSGWNVKASVKVAGGKGAPKAKTGARAKFDNVKDAVAAFDKLCAQAIKRDWRKVEKTVRNAFDEIPAPSKPKSPIAPDAPETK